jgi:adenylate cyclase
MLEIQCLPDKQKVQISQTETILEANLAAGIPHTHACGGNALCSTCRIMVIDGVQFCTPPTAAEKALTKKLGFPENIRLACQTGVSGNIVIRRLVIDNEDIDIVDSQLSIGSVGERKSVAILVAAIRGATDFDEVKFPYDIVYVLSRYFNRMNKVINRHGGAINNVMGSRFMAIFGLDNLDQVAERSVWAGLEMLESVNELNVHLESMSYQPIKLSVGIHYGAIVSINVDPSKANMVTAIGNAANLANRIESLNKEVGSTLLVSEPIYYQVQDQAVTGRSGNLNLPDGNRCKLFELTAMRGSAPPAIEKAGSASLSQKVMSFMQRFSGGKTGGKPKK